VATPQHIKEWVADEVAIMSDDDLAVLHGAVVSRSGPALDLGDDGA